jgi:hypothetical protein
MLYFHWVRPPFFVVPTRLQIVLAAIPAPQFNSRARVIGDRRLVKFLATEKGSAALHIGRHAGVDRTLSGS